MRGLTTFDELMDLPLLTAEIMKPNPVSSRQLRSSQAVNHVVCRAKSAGTVAQPSARVQRHGDETAPHMSYASCFSMDNAMYATTESTHSTVRSAAPISADNRPLDLTYVLAWLCSAISHAFTPSQAP